MCSSCGLRGPRYCSLECQKVHWKAGHYKLCEATEAARRTSQTQESQNGEIPLTDLNQSPEQHHEVEEDNEDFADELKFYTQQIYLVIKPVVVCIVLSIFWVKVAFSGQSDYSPSRPSYSVLTSNTGSGGDGQYSAGGGSPGVLNSFTNAAIIIAQIIVVTVIIVFLFRKGWIKILIGFFMIVVLLLLGFMTNLVQVFSIPLDYITLAFSLWNFTVVGLISIFWKGPLWLQQCYLTVMSSLMAFAMTGLEQWTTWILLGLLAIWDLIAVLCPFGPLRLLIESSRREEREVPALLYSVNAVWFMMAPGDQLCLSRTMAGDTNGSSRIQHASSRDRSSCESTDPEARKRALTHTSLTETVQSRTSSVEYEPSTTSTSPLQRNRPARENSAGEDDDETIQPSENTVETTHVENESRRRNSRTNTRRDSVEDRDEEDVERSGLKLGLGDFVFYSVLIARAAMYDWITTVCCTIAVLTGLTATIFLLAIYKKALPALPISIAFGILFYFVAKTVLVPYVGALCVFGMVGL
ncbi:hypothetical protein DFQ30_004351 [Apophysomyces sp. BC1015]|nr:hypothetical protein DFQ30_004351 [Apophysomyces sp. BC1015]